MTTDMISEEVHTAVPVIPATDAPIKFDISQSAIVKMEKEAGKLSIKGPDDKTGFNAVYQFRQMVKDQRIDVEKRQAALKRPHIDYNRDVDAMAKSLIEPMKAIEKTLAIQEKEYDDERKRIVEERERAIRLRAEQRVERLKVCGFSYDVMSDAWAFGKVVINFDDIKGFSDEEYAPTAELVKATYEAEQQRIAEEKMKDERSRGRIDQLRAWGFVWNSDNEMYQFIDGLGNDQYFVFPEAIRNDSDEKYAAIAGTAKRAYEAEQARLAEVKRLADEQAEANRKEAERLKAIADLQDVTQKAIDNARKELEAARCKMILDSRKPQLESAGFDWNGSRFKLLNVFRLGETDVVDMTDEQFADLLTDAKAKIKEAADEADQVIEAQKKAEAAEKKANKERTNRLKKDKADFAEWLRLHQFEEPLISITQPEVIAINQAFNTEMRAVVDKYNEIIKAL